MGQPLENHIRKLQDFYWSEADPDGRGFVPLADALRRAGDFLEANRLLRDGLSRYPGYLSGHIVAGWLNRDRGKLEEAEASFRAALELDPGNVAALKGLGEIFASRGEFELSLDLFNQLLHEDPTDLSLPGRIHELQEEFQGHGETAPDEIEQASSVWEDPEGAAEDLDLEGASLQEDRSKVESAADTEDGGFPEADEVRTHEPVSTGIADLEAAQDGKSLPDQALGALGPEDEDDSLVTSTLGEIYLRQGLLERAEEVFEALLDRDPENEGLAARLEEVRRRKRGEAPAAAEEPGGPAAVEPSSAEEPLAQEIPSIGLFAPDEPESSPEEDPDSEIPSIELFAPDEPESPREEVGPPPEEEVGPPEILSIDVLAPDEPVPVPIQALAPEALPIEALAPEPGTTNQGEAPPEDRVVSIASLAPVPETIVSIEALAPDSPDPTLDAFESWLEKLQ